MHARLRFSRFTRTASVHDLRSTAAEQARATIARKARRWEVLRHTSGRLAVFGLLLAALAGCTVAPFPPKVFVCEADGELSEQHWGVASANRNAAGMWRIRYTDGRVADYLQHQGEACWTEVQS